MQPLLVCIVCNMELFQPANLFNSILYWKTEAESSSLSWFSLDSVRAQDESRCHLLGTTAYVKELLVRYSAEGDLPFNLSR